MSLQLASPAKAEAPKPLPPLGRHRFVQRRCACGSREPSAGECSECGKKGLLQKSSTNSGLRSVPPIVSDVLRSPGHRLDAPTQSFMESRFGHNFSEGRIHSDYKASESARAVNALAYTAGRDLVFAAGHYAPHTDEGRRLLAHELTHVRQQEARDATSTEPLQLDDPSSRYEHEAATAEALVPGTVSSSVPGVIHRKTKGTDTSPGLCGGTRTCAAGTACDLADNIFVGPVPESTWWKLTVMIDVEAATAAEVTEKTPGHAYVKFSESNGNIYTYGFYPDPARPPNILRTETTGCVVHPDAIHETCVDYKEEFTLTGKEYEKSLGLAKAACQAKPNYNLQTFNCTTFADRVVKAAGKSLPAIRGTVGSGMFSLAADNPNTLLEGLRARDAAKKSGSSPQ